MLEGKANVIMSWVHLEILSDAEKIKRAKWTKVSPLISVCLYLGWMCHNLQSSAKPRGRCNIITDYMYSKGAITKKGEGTRASKGGMA